jgi:hypothetical protein
LEEYSYGRFAWIVDGDGNRIELWEPIDTRRSDSNGNGVQKDETNRRQTRHRSRPYGFGPGITPATFILIRYTTSHAVT